MSNETSLVPFLEMHPPPPGLTVYREGALLVLSSQHFDIGERLQAWKWRVTSSFLIKFFAPIPMLLICLYYAVYSPDFQLSCIIALCGLVFFECSWGGCRFCLEPPN